MKTLRKVSIIKLMQLVVVFLMVMSSSMPSTASQEPIVIEREKPVVNGAPRSQETCPFYAVCHYNAVYLSSLDSLGTVTVELSSTAGDSYASFFDTSNEGIVIPLSGFPGYYLLKITVNPEIRYIGRFEL